MNIVVRTAKLSDADFIVNAQLAMALETENLQLDTLVVTKGVTAVFNDSNKGEYLVAEIADQNSIQIIACLLTIPEWSDWRNGTVLWIHSVWVMPAFRKHGAYKKMYQHLESRVRNDATLRGLRLYVDKSNSQAQKVYESLGMSSDHYHLYEWLK